VIDSLAGFEMALAPGFRADFRESLYRMITALTGVGVTILSTVEVNESFTEFPFSTYSMSFLTDDIIRLRYVCIDGAQNLERPGGSAIDARTTHHAGYAISQRKRKRVEECFGWLKTIACCGRFGIVESSRWDGSSLLPRPPIT
jgi:hypothetical protein